MIPIHPQYIIDENLNRKAVILTWDDWQRIMEEQFAGLKCDPVEGTELFHCTGKADTARME